MLVVSDTTPLNYLVLTEAEKVLPVLFGSVLVPSQVIDELQRQRAPERVRASVKQLPAWIHVQEGDASRFPALDPGEAAALALAVDERAQLLADDAEARLIASSVGIVTIGHSAYWPRPYCVLARFRGCREGTSGHDLSHT